MNTGIIAIVEPVVVLVDIVDHEVAHLPGLVVLVVAEDVGVIVVLCPSGIEEGLDRNYLIGFGGIFIKGSQRGMHFPGLFVVPTIILLFGRSGSGGNHEIDILAIDGHLPTESLDFGSGEGLLRSGRVCVVVPDHFEPVFAGRVKLSDADHIGAVEVVALPYVAVRTMYGNLCIVD